MAYLSLNISNPDGSAASISGEVPTEVVANLLTTAKTGIDDAIKNAQKAAAAEAKAAKESK